MTPMLINDRYCLNCAHSSGPPNVCRLGRGPVEPLHWCVQWEDHCETTDTRSSSRRSPQRPAGTDLDETNTQDRADRRQSLDKPITERTPDPHA